VTHSYQNCDRTTTMCHDRSKTFELHRILFNGFRNMKSRYWLLDRFWATRAYVQTFVHKRYKPTQLLYRKQCIYAFDICYITVKIIKFSMNPSLLSFFYRVDDRFYKFSWPFITDAKTFRKLTACLFGFFM